MESSATQVSAAEVGLTEVCEGEGRAPEVGLTEVCEGEGRAPEVRLAEIRHEQVRPLEVCFAEVCEGQDRPLEVRIGQLRLYFRILWPPLIPGLNTLLEDVEMLRFCHSSTL